MRGGGKNIHLLDESLIEMPTDEEIRKYFGVTSIIGVDTPEVIKQSEEALKEDGIQKGHEFDLKLDDVFKYANDLAHEDVCDMLEALDDLLLAVKNENLASACDYLCDIQKSMAQCIRILENQAPKNEYSSRFAKMDAQEVVSSLFNDSMALKLDKVLEDIAAPEEKGRYVQLLKGMFEMFFSKEPEREIGN